jgi:hypothetical protein
LINTITPTPWYVSEVGGHVCIQSASINEDNFVCYVEGRTPREALNNANMIIDCVNNRR